MVGREQEMSQLLALLENPELGLITLHGLG
jgi:hypothetical protein